MLARITDMLPPFLRPYAKAVTPAAATIVTVAAQWIATGDLNAAELRTAVEGALLALVAFAFPNVSATKPKA